MHRPSLLRRLGPPTLKLLVLLLVLWSVHNTLQSGFEQLRVTELHVHWPWLVAGGAFYLTAYMPMAWYWRRSLVALGQRPSRLTVQWAYWAGHVAKYVPGKAVLVMVRVAILAEEHIAPRATIVTVFLETLTLMSVGALIAAGLSLILFDFNMPLILLGIGVALVAGIPTWPPVAKWLSQLLLERRPSIEAESKPQAYPPMKLDGISYRLIASGWIASLVCWLGLALSLWATLRSIGVTDTDLLGDLALLLGAVTLSTVAGFASMLPGGIGVRDALVIALLAEHYGDSPALIAGVLLRLVWLFAELAMCGLAYGLHRARPVPLDPPVCSNPDS